MIIRSLSPFPSPSLDIVFIYPLQLKRKDKDDKAKVSVCGRVGKISLTNKQNTNTNLLIIYSSSDYLSSLTTGPHLASTGARVCSANQMRQP